MDPEPPPDYVEFVAECLPVLQGEATRLVGGTEHADEVSTEALTDIAGQWRRLQWRSRLTKRDAPAEQLRRRLTARARQWREEQIYEVDVRVGASPAAPRTEAAPLAEPSSGPRNDAAAVPVDFEPVRWAPASRESVARQSVGLQPAGRQPVDWGAWAQDSEPSGPAATPPALRPAAPIAPGAVSVARRLAPLVDPTVRPQARPVAEAAIAWVHAYQRHKWRQFGRIVLAVFIVTSVIIRLLSQLPDV